jgi:hypothetical protein
MRLEGQAIGITKEYFTKIVESLTASAKVIAFDLSSKIRMRFPLDKLLESMAIVFPQYWSLNCLSDF